jgi:hypothetical protein
MWRSVSFTVEDVGVERFVSVIDRTCLTGGRSEPPCRIRALRGEGAWTSKRIPGIPGVLDPTTLREVSDVQAEAKGCSSEGGCAD